jgi:hypothetical protein
VAVGVVRADRDQSDARGRAREEDRIGRPGAVVGHGEQTGAQRIGTAGGDTRVGEAQEVGLGRPFDVTGHQGDAVPPGGAEHQGGVVECAVRVPVRPAGWWTEHLQVQVPDQRLGRRGHHAHRHGRGSGGGIQPLDGGDGFR